MRCSGISDEAGASVDVQIRAHKELGWQYMELRMVDGENVALVPDSTFDGVYGEIVSAGLRVSAFAGTIGNWAKSIAGDFVVDVAELRQVIPRMQRCNTTYLRIMTWPNDPDSPWSEKAWRDESIRRVGELAGIAEDGGIVMAIENCRGWAGLSPENALEFLAEVDSPAVQWLYDTGNVVNHGQDPWDFYSKIRERIAYLHIKDCRRLDDGRSQAVYCGEGDAMVREILADRMRSGHDDFVSIEPHLAAVVHTGQASDPETMYRTYVEYGTRLNAILAELDAPADPGGGDDGAGPEAKNAELAPDQLGHNPRQPESFTIFAAGGAALRDCASRQMACE